MLSTEISNPKTCSIPKEVGAARSPCLLWKCLSVVDLVGIKLADFGSATMDGETVRGRPPVRLQGIYLLNWTRFCLFCSMFEHIVH